MERPVVRLAVIVVCLCLVGWMLVDYAAHEDERSEYPTDRELADSFESYHGDAVFLWVDVVAATEDGYVGQFGRNDTTVTVREVERDVDPGDVVQVYGTARAGHRIDAERIVVSESNGRTYMFVASAVAAIWSAGFALWHWRPDRRRGGFRRRGDR